MFHSVDHYCHYSWLPVMSRHHASSVGKIKEAVFILSHQYCTNIKISQLVIHHTQSTLECHHPMDHYSLHTSFTL